MLLKNDLVEVFKKLSRGKLSEVELEITEEAAATVMLVSGGYPEAYEKGKENNVVELIKENGKTYVKINDYDQLKTLFGELLREIQRIKSEGDYEAGKNLIETYCVKVDQEIHKEVLDRYATLNIKPYSGFIQPRLSLVKDDDGKVIDVKLEYVDSFFEQMLEYGKNYNFLPTFN